MLALKSHFSATLECKKVFISYLLLKAKKYIPHKTPFSMSSNDNMRSYMCLVTSEMENRRILFVKIWVVFSQKGEDN